MARCLRWSLMLGDFAAVGTSVWQCGGSAPGDDRSLAATLVAASVSLAWAVGGGVARRLEQMSAVVTLADVGNA